MTCSSECPSQMMKILVPIVSKFGYYPSSSLTSFPLATDQWSTDAIIAERDSLFSKLSEMVTEPARADTDPLAQSSHSEGGSTDNSAEWDRRARMSSTENLRRFWRGAPRFDAGERSSSLCTCPLLTNLGI
jgi:hypothetical protein